MFAHRSGETEPPTKAGYYWFRGRVFRQRWKGMLLVVDNEDGTLGVTVGNMSMSFYGYVGQYWGPITTPWKQDDKEQEA